MGKKFGEDLRPPLDDSDLPSLANFPAGVNLVSLPTPLVGGKVIVRLGDLHDGIRGFREREGIPKERDARRLT